MFLSGEKTKHEPRETSITPNDSILYQDKKLNITEQRETTLTMNVTNKNIKGTDNKQRETNLILNVGNVW